MSATSAMASILSAAHGLHQSGVIDKATMHAYEALCLTPVPERQPLDRASMGIRAKTPLQARRQTAVGGGEARDFGAGLTATSETRNYHA